jgi:two-component system chemotaxis response regulator CheY
MPLLRLMEASGKAAALAPMPLALIADSQRSMRRFLRCLLESRGYRTAEACTSEDVVVAIRPDDQPALVLLSLDLAEGEEVALTEKVRERTAARIVIMGWHGDHPLVARALDSGANDYLMKPFTAQALLDRLALLSVSPP